MPWRFITDDIEIREVVVQRIFERYEYLLPGIVFQSFKCLISGAVVGGL